MPRKPGPQLTSDDVVEAAACVLQRDGYDGLTMRAVAGELNVKAPALYWHVRSKEDLSLLLFDHLISGLDYGAPTGDWRADLRRMAQALRTRLVETRDITRLFPDDYSGGPRAARPLEMSLGLFRQAGLRGAEALMAYGVALSFVVGWARFEATRRSQASPAEAPPAPSPNLAWALTDGPTAPEAGFEFGLDLLIAGLERRLELRAQGS